jgi:hypothetical protein
MHLQSSFARYNHIQTVVNKYTVLYTKRHTILFCTTRHFDFNLQQLIRHTFMEILENSVMQKSNIYF